MAQDFSDYYKITSNSPFAKVPLGKVIRSRLIYRSDVADGTRGRAIPLFDSVIGAYVVFSDNPKGTYFCSPEEAVAYGLSPRFYYFIPLARLNTDSKANVLDNSVVVEYLRVSSAQYNELSASMEDNPSFTSFILSKQVAVNFSFVKIALSNKALVPAVLQAVQATRASLQEDQVYQFIFTDVGKPFSSYIEELHGVKSGHSEDDVPEVTSPPLSPQGLPSPTALGSSQVPQYRSVAQSASAPPVPISFDSTSTSASPTQFDEKDEWE